MIKVIKYSKWSYVLIGEETKKIMEPLKVMGAKWNINLGIGKGWIISIKKWNECQDLLKQYQIEYTIDEQMNAQKNWIHTWNHEKCEYIINDLLKNEDCNNNNMMELYRKHFQLQDLSDLDKKIFEVVVKFAHENKTTEDHKRKKLKN